ncbi:hypothetical protein [Actinacidiphila paucisporea]|uniref:Uncharacterized protein n=1 Tax=Actinacidiphila paucisporea TaxID=310782 RepID=A0A1M7E7I3_9ACTN|nr:hypothetical protein [Actinacidiphila paucisporea]SHL87704.1 hypothetical protein SAMN05216499_106318 [Actinacidiphila paucisporea]
MPENDEPTPSDGTGSSTPPAAADGGTVEVETPRTKIQVAVIGAAGLVVAGLLTLIGTLVATGGDSGDHIGPPAGTVVTGVPAPPASTTPPVTTAPPVVDKPCATPRKAHGFTAAFVSPCTGATLKSPYPVITLKVTGYPEDAAQGRLWVFVRILTNGRGTPLADRPMYGGSPIDAGHARQVGATTWAKDLQVYGSCHEYGAAQILTYWLSPSGARQAAKWQAGQAVTAPSGSVKLDEVTVNMEAGDC